LAGPDGVSRTGMFGLFGGVALRCTLVPPRDSGGVAGVAGRCGPSERGRTARIGGACFEIVGSPDLGRGCGAAPGHGGRSAGRAVASPRTGSPLRGSTGAGGAGRCGVLVAARCTAGADVTGVAGVAGVVGVAVVEVGAGAGTGVGVARVLDGTAATVR
jgi:hypothetical protein